MRYKNVADVSVVLSQFMPLTDRRTDRQTDFWLMTIPGKN